MFDGALLAIRDRLRPFVSSTVKRPNLDLFAGGFLDAKALLNARVDQKNSQSEQAEYDLAPRNRILVWILNIMTGLANILVYVN